MCSLYVSVSFFAVAARTEWRAVCVKEPSMARRSVQCGGTAPEDEVCDHGTAEIPCGICIQGQFIF